MDYLRKKYRILLISVILIVGIVISAIIYLGLRDVDDMYHEYAAQSIMDIKKAYLKDTVNNVISGIKQKNDDQVEYYQHLTDDIVSILDDHYQIDSEGFLNFAHQYMQQEIKKQDFTFFIIERQTQKILYLHMPSIEISDVIDIEYIDMLEEKMPVYEKKIYGKYSIIAGVDQTIVDNQVKSLLYNEIHSFKFADDAYIWVNEVINYEGGDNYAIRRIHPNLKNSEGIYLSTSMTDIKGTFPYKTELEGVKQYGELFFQYYFKKLDSDIISEKITFAKLYKNYNWIIAMGVHLDDIQEYVTSTSKDKNEQVSVLILIISSVIIAFIFVVLLTIHFLERWYYNNSNKTLIEENQKDPLTQTYNRRAAYKYLSIAWSNYKSIGVNSTIMMMDIDDFKKVNDSCGHSIGDNVLVELADKLNGHIRSNDFLCRWGGEEFLLICNGLKKQDVEAFSSKLLKEVENMRFNCSEVDKLNITISIGVSEFYPEDEQFSMAINRADLALYQAKAQGKNRCVVMEDNQEKSDL
jgi:diguanylate cyclase (GGDEF)-like protein